MEKAIIINPQIVMLIVVLLLFTARTTWSNEDEILKRLPRIKANERVQSWA